MSLHSPKHIKPNKHHRGENCPKCKETVGKMLDKIYNKTDANHKFSIGVKPEDLKQSKYYSELKSIYIALQSHRGHNDFVRAKKLAGCDFFVSNPPFILEFDESQHFTLPRKIALEMYPKELKIGFDRKKWIELCERLNKKDNDPPFRDEQRAWYDTLRDFLPTIMPLEPTRRIYSKCHIWCDLNPDNESDIEKFTGLINI